MLDFIRIACAVPRVKPGDVQKNARDICDYIAKADSQGADLLVLPELALTGYSCGDLFLQDALWHGVQAGVQTIAECSKDHPQITVAVGLPVRLGGRLLNCAVIFAAGKIRGIVPKTYLSGEEGRWFSSADALQEGTADLRALGFAQSGCCEVGANLLTGLADGAVLGIELCEDMNAPIPPSSLLALNGANVIANLSASNSLAGKREGRNDLVKHQSSACNCIYAYCSAGYTESTSDLIYSGHSVIAENGRILCQNSSAADTDYMLVQDCDLGRIRADRLKNVTFRSASARFASGEYALDPVWEHRHLRSDGALYPLKKLSFVPSEKQLRQRRCREIFQLQVTGLKQRLATVGSNAVIGISGGLDSTLALLVAVEAMRQLGRPASDVYGVTMPCFGTSDRTYENAWELMRKLGIHAREISIKEAVSRHFADIGHDSSVHNATYENAQARERTQILMDYASVAGGLVVGTGDLSELALGWCTYNGDHMSMYAVNATIPKTLIRWIIETVAEDPCFVAAKDVLMDILDTPISPELLPPDAQGKISQQTEDLVGPYALHDFFLYHVLRFGFTPTKIYTLACRAFQADFDVQTVKKWLKNFYRRFFTQQFKRNCMPDGVKVGTVSLGPRGDWRMPSDASAALWLEEAERL